MITITAAINDAMTPINVTVVISINGGVSTDALLLKCCQAKACESVYFLVSEPSG